jgi:hypothetical protein
MANIFNAFEGDMQYWNGNAWMMITAPTENAGSLSFCDGQPTWTQGGCPVYYEIGDQGPAGGIVFYVSNEGLNGLEAAPVDQGQAKWGCSQTEIPSAESPHIGSGALNTAAILGGCNEEDSAADLADRYEFNGFSDWFLPADYTTRLLWENRHVLGHFEYDWYWSSTQHYKHVQFAASVSHNPGNVRPNHKNQIYGVRAVREF